MLLKLGKSCPGCKDGLATFKGDIPAYTPVIKT